MDDLDLYHESLERVPPVLIRAIPQEFCRKCLTPMASHLLEDGLCIDCDLCDN